MNKITIRTYGAVYNFTRDVVLEITPDEKMVAVFPYGADENTDELPLLFLPREDILDIVRDDIDEYCVITDRKAE